jgi:hypothetical protein
MKRSHLQWTRILALAGVLLGSALAFGPDARGQSDDSYKLTRQAFALGLRTSGVYDSNVNHDEEDIDSRGVIAGIEARLQSSASQPVLTLIYQGTLQRFAKTDRWNRIEHRAGGILYGGSGPLSIVVVGLVDLGSATQERERGNQYTFLPQTILRMGPVRLRAYGGLRVTRVDEEAGTVDPEAPGPLDDVTVYGGGEVRWRAGDGSSWGVEYRYERSDSDSPYRRYTQQRYAAHYRAEFMKESRLELGLEYRPRRFPDLLVAVEGVDEGGEPVAIDEPRDEARWIPSISVSHVFPWGQEVELEYEYQHRTSNDLDKEFEAHRATLTVRLPLIARYRKTAIDE